MIPDFGHHADRLAELWRNTHARADDYSHEILTPAYFREIAALARPQPRDRDPTQGRDRRLQPVPVRRRRVLLGPRRDRLRPCRRRRQPLSPALARHARARVRAGSQADQLGHQHLRLQVQTGLRGGAPGLLREARRGPAPDRGPRARPAGRHQAAREPPSSVPRPGRRAAARPQGARRPTGDTRGGPRRLRKVRICRRSARQLRSRSPASTASSRRSRARRDRSSVTGVDRSSCSARTPTSAWAPTRRSSPRPRRRSTSTARAARARRCSTARSTSTSIWRARWPPSCRRRTPSCAARAIRRTSVSSPRSLGEDDVLIMDQLDHASLVDGARLSHAQVARFRHNDIDSLETRADSVPRPAQVRDRRLRLQHGGHDRRPAGHRRRSSSAMARA